MLARLNMPTVITAAVTVLVIAVVALFGPQLGIPLEVARGALAFLGALGTIALGAMRRFLADEDGDGRPDGLQPPQEPEQ